MTELAVGLFLIFGMTAASDDGPADETPERRNR